MILKNLIYRPIAVGIFFFGLSILGLLSLERLPVSLLPELSYPALLVQTRYPQGNTEAIEKQITEVIELQLATVSGVKQILSSSQNGLSTITILFEWGQDMLLAQLAVRNKIAAMRSSLPELANPSEIFSIDPATLPLMKLVITSKSFTLQDLSDFSRHVLKRRFEQLSDIALAQIEGADERIVDIRLDLGKCQKYRIAIERIKEKIQANNVFQQGGIIRDGFLRLSLRMESQIQSLEELKSLILYQKKGMHINLGQIADIRFGTTPKTASIIWKNQEAIQINITRKRQANAVDASEDLRKVIRQLESEFRDVKIDVAFDDSVFVEESISAVFQTLLWGSIFAFFVLFIFLKELRYPIQIFISIPVSISITFIFLYIQKISLNMMSLGGLALGIGLLVDNSIVVLENIVRLKKAGETKLQAVLKGTQQVISPVIASTLTTISVFAPLLLVPGIGGAVFKEQSLTIIYSLVISLFVSIFLLPILFFHFDFKREKETKNQIKHSPFNSIKRFFLWSFWSSVETIQIVIEILRIHLIFEFIRKELNIYFHFYHRLLGRLLKRPRIPLIIGIFLSLFSFWAIFQLDKSWIPRLSKTAIAIECNFESGISLNFIEKEMNRLQTSIDSILHPKQMLVMNGKVSQEFSDQARLREEKAFLYLFFEYSVNATVKQRINTILRFFPTILAEQKAIKTPFEVIFSRFNIDNTILLLSPNRFELNRAANYLSQFRDLKSLLPSSSKQWKFKINQEKQRALNISSNEIESILQSFSDGVYSGNFSAEQDILPIYIRNKGPFSESKIDEYTIFNGGKAFSLGTFLEKKEVKEVSRFFKQNLIYVAPFKFLDENLNLDKLNARLEAFPLSELVKSFESKEVQHSLDSLLWVALLALLLVFMILAAQFESFKLPFIILFTIPMALVGVAVTFLVTGTALSMMAILGMIVLIGIVVNDAIIKIDFIERERKRGVNLTQAILNAGEKRFRPILMTTFTTTLALLPMLLLKGGGYELRFPMALTLFSGLTMATFLTLFYIPLLYQFFVGRANK